MVSGPVVFLHKILKYRLPKYPFADILNTWTQRTGRGGELEKKMATKLEMECKLLMVEHDIKRESNNESAFIFRANMATSDAEKSRNLETARFYSSRKVDAEKVAENLRAAIAETA